MKTWDKEAIWNLGVAATGMVFFINGIFNGTVWQMIKAHAMSGVYSEESAKNLYKSIKYSNLNKVKKLIKK